MDIVDNSLRARAENIDIRLVENTTAHTLTLEIKDDGPGMDDDMLQNAMNPFFTTKDGKRFGLGLSLLAQSAEDAGGTMTIAKGPEHGIMITATFQTDNVDMKPMGKIDKTLRVLRAAHPEVTISFEHLREF
jgi:C4-dicarboxylate-specific signal transduction histidine kinase